MMTGTFHFADNLSVTIRGTTSSNGPGGTGTTILIVRWGKSSAAIAPPDVVAIAHMAATRQVAIEERARWLIDRLLRLAVQRSNQWRDIRALSESCHGANVPGIAQNPSPGFPKFRIEIADPVTLECLQWVRSGDRPKHARECTSRCRRSKPSRARFDGVAPR